MIFHKTRPFKIISLIFQNRYPAILLIIAGIAPFLIQKKTDLNEFARIVQKDTKNHSASGKKAPKAGKESGKKNPDNAVSPKSAVKGKKDKKKSRLQYDLPFYCGC